jgi:hypothetical protein
VGQILHKTGPDRIADRDHDERHGRRFLLHRQCRRRSCGDDYIDLGGNEF